MSEHIYLATLSSSSGTFYEIRRSYPQANDRFTHDTLFELGTNPETHFELYEDFIIMFTPQLIEAIAAVFKGNVDDLLEKLLWDFLPAEAKAKKEYFPPRRNISFGPLSEQEKIDISQQVHIFDRRRLYYLRYGAVDQSRLSKLHEKCCRPLLGQSRDEREFYFQAEEKSLEPGMYLQYVYAIFNLQKYFNESFAPWFPEALAREEMGDHFEKAICSLQADRSFWQDESVRPFLHHHLSRYLIMFFDFNATPRSFLGDYARTFMNNHRTFRWPEKKGISSEKISEIFSTPIDQLRALSKTSLNKLYREKAMELHPDTGGDHERFIELTEGYNQLLHSLHH